MANRPKQIGTFAEVSVLQVLEPYFPSAKRLVLKGKHDEGDLDAGDDTVIMFEVKGGKQCAQVGEKKLAGWMAETDRERDELGKRFGFLVTQRAGYGRPNAGRWWAHVHLGDLAEITGGHYRPGAFAVVRLELRDLLELLADHGYTADKDAPVTAMTEPIHIIEDATVGELFKPGFMQLGVVIPKPVDHEVLTAPSPRADDWN